MRMEPVEQVPPLVRRIYEVTDELARLFPGRPFTPDGHLVGSIGEVLAAYRYDLVLLPPSEPTHDAETRDGRRVQIKATQGNTVALRDKPLHLVVLRLGRDDLLDEVFNGPGSIAWAAAGRKQKNGQRPLSCSKLKQLMQRVPSAQRIPTVRI